MMDYTNCKLYIFDLDGTLLNTSAGIRHCYDHAADAFGRPRLTARQFAGGVIGGPLRRNLQRHFALSDGQTDEAVNLYRREYARAGVKMAAHYDGVKAVLACVKARGAYAAVATLKREDLARAMLADFGLAQYFDAIYGMDEADTRTKAGLVQRCLDAFGVRPEDALLVGDSVNDAAGAAEAHVRCLGVGYGFGFATCAEAEQAGCAAWAATPGELRALLCGAALG